jgi:glyoxylase I family protein
VWVAAGQKIVKIGRERIDALLATALRTTHMSDHRITLGRMDHVALPTSDAARGERFYCDVLGFHTVPRPSFSFDGRWLVHDSVGVMLHLIHEEDFKPKASAINTRRGHFALRCPDVDAAIAALREYGIELIERRLPDYGYRQIFIQDPDGNVLELGEWAEM